jgi:hypothetical protein
MGEKKYNDNCLHKIWGPKKRCEEEEEEKDAHSDLFFPNKQRKEKKNKSDCLAQHSETGSKPSTV